ncbi:nicotinate-nucleotide adenylyltransferase [Oryzomonas rubra]|uniref:Probable nicotinate-nucleotide adenylyltransferase n=1 Tax=Oryzomonas rubra TaxID=2509454 RepID=A0A5A9XBH2_9BACT|nr:nicotinate-nucleotide adenylyltransferase [Oryzomonas rubra]KAA0889795.1 nicotinate (nicotinamide) nucleotide adenylyltransferase [Oryzomonas rubra]
MRIGLMGGTFNPVHLAHLHIAEEAREACALDRVVFIPTGDPPHKPLAGEVPFAQRSRMVALAISGNPFFELSLVEGERAGKSYSIDTIRVFRERFPQDELSFIIGSDSFLEIGQWYRFREIFASCNLIVVERPGKRISDPVEALPVAIRAEFSYTSGARRLDHTAGTSVQFLSGCPLDISSSEIRELAAAGRSIADLVPPQVAAYITEQGIYNTCRSQKRQ